MLTIASGSATIGTTEYFLASASTTATYQTAQGTFKFLLDLNAMTAGDQYQITIYEKVNGGTARAVMAAAYPTGAQSSLWESPEFYVAEGWEVGVKKIAGTDRAIAWSLRRVNGAAIATAILDAAYEGSRTVRGFFRVVRSLLINKASGLEGVTVTFRDDADTKNRVSFALSGGTGKNARVPTIDET